MTNSKIRIANFKSFADQTVELNAFNLLVGANASGKSNFVQALKFLARHHSAWAGGCHLSPGRHGVLAQPYDR